MMFRDFSDWVFFAVIIGFVCACVFVIFFQSGKIEDCTKRGGYAVDTSTGWVCAKLEKV